MLGGEQAPYDHKKLAEVEQRCGKNSVQVAKHLVATIQACASHADKANHLRRAAEIFEHNGMLNSEEWTQCSLYLGMKLIQMSDYNAAAPVLEGALVGLRKLFPPDHADIAEALRGLEDCYRRQGRAVESKDARAAAVAIERRSQTRCAGPRCRLKARSDGAPLDVCINCRRTHYCSKACQTADWKAGHKAECKTLIAAAAVAAEGSGGGQ